MTLYLRGIAIIIVLVNHYVNYYLSDQFGGYAYRLVSFFFVLSGFGIYHSLNNAISQGTMNSLPPSVSTATVSRRQAWKMST